MSEELNQQDQQPLRKAMLENLQQSGNISKSARATGIDRTTHYLWCRESQEYAALSREAIELAREERIDKLEDAIMDMALGNPEEGRAGNPISQIFALKALTRGNAHGRTWSDAPPEIVAPPETNDTPSLTSTNQEAIQEMMSQYILKLKTADTTEPTSDKPNATGAE